MVVYYAVVTVALCVCVDVDALFFHLSSHSILQYKAVFTPTPNKPFGPSPALSSLPLPLPFSSSPF